MEFIDNAGLTGERDFEPIPPLAMTGNGRARRQRGGATMFGQRHVTLQPRGRGLRKGSLLVLGLCLARSLPLAAADTASAPAGRDLQPATSQDSSGQQASSSPPGGGGTEAVAAVSTSSLSSDSGV